MKKNHAAAWTWGAVAFAAALCSAVLFLLKKDFDTAAWVLYGATLAAFALVGSQLAAGSPSGFAIVMNTALGVVTAVFFGIQLVFGGIVCMFFEGLPLTPVVVCEIVLIGAYLVITFLVFGASSQEKSDQQAVRKMRLLENDVRALMDEAEEPEVRKALGSLAEAVHYSDVANLPALTDLENRIAENMALLTGELQDKKGNPLARIGIIQSLLKERDRQAAALK